jgi:hypothetical protein
MDEEASYELDLTPDSPALVPAFKEGTVRVKGGRELSGGTNVIARGSDSLAERSCGLPHH